MAASPIEARVKAGIPPPRQDAFRLDYQFEPVVADGDNRRHPIHVTALNYVDLLTGESPPPSVLSRLFLLLLLCRLAGLSSKMATSYKPLLPGLYDGVLRLETVAGVEGRQQQLQPKIAVIPLEDAVRYFANPELTADVLSRARDVLIQDWNNQPDGKKFALEWQEELCTHTWPSHDGDEWPNHSAVVVTLNTFLFTQQYQEGSGAQITAADVPVSCSLLFLSASFPRKDARR